MYHYAVGNVTHGPVPLEELRGRITPSTLVWRESMPDWKPASELPELRTLWTTPSVPSIARAHPEPSEPSLAPMMVYAGPGTSATHTPGLATTSLVLGIVSVPLICLWPVSLLCAALAVGFGFAARAQCQREVRPGGGMALAGIILGFVPLAAFVAGILFFLLALIGSAMH